MQIRTEQVDYYVWQPAGYAVQVVIRPQAAERMRREARYRDSARPGGEAGGLLLGSIDREGSGSVTVEDVEPLAWSYMMPPQDRVELEAALKALDAGPRRSVIGYFRTHSREGLFLNAGDLSLIKACFPDPANVFLLLKSIPGEPLASRLFFWHNGVTRSAVAERECPFGRPVLEPARIPEPRRRLPVPPEPEREEARPRGRGTLWAVGAATVITAGLLLFPSRWYTPQPDAQDTAAPAAPARLIGLEVEKRSNDLVIKWDRGAPAVLTATRAILHIEDGLYRRASLLDPDQLRTGSLYYSPASGEIRLRLEVYDPAGTQVVESVQVLSPTVLPSGAAPFESEQQPIPAAQPSKPAKDWGFVLKTLRSLQSRYTPKAPEPRPAAVVETPPPALSGEATVLTAAAPGIPGFAPGTPPPAAPASKPVADPKPAPPPQPQRIPARPISQVNPVVPGHLRSTLKDDVQLGVRVEIDAAGKVTDAHIITRRGTPSEFLAGAAISAARRWQFEPATLGGKPVPGEMILNFRFMR
ncbi:MAG TPA: energy transducer TonB [Bryobacteraceae bacterium]|nr:energy transducer TonB [Bryobacteraceae bacterium]